MHKIHTVRHPVVCALSVGVVLAATFLIPGPVLRSQSGGAPYPRGTVDFNNAVQPGVTNGLFYDSHGIPLAGTNYLAQLYAGTSSNALVAVGTPVPFATGNRSGYFFGGEVSLPMVPSGESAWVQVRAWDATGGATSYEQAAAAGQWTGLSNVLWLPYTGGVGIEPPAGPVALNGLRFLGTPNPPLPVITAQPTSQSALPGATLTFSAAGTNGVIAYQWRFGGQPLAGETNQTLVLSRVKVSQAGSYDVILSNASGSIPSQAATLTVITGPDTPVILREPSDQNVRPGEQATLILTASGTASLTYQWYQGMSGDTGAPLAGATNATYTTPAMSVSATFWVSVGNAFGTLDSTTAAVNVFPANSARLTAQADSSGVRLTLDGQVGTTYRVDYSTDLRGTNWTTLKTIALTNNPLSFLDASAAGSPRRFYRAVAP